MAPSDVHLFCPLRETVGGKRCRANDEVKLLCNGGWTRNYRLFLKAIMSSTSDSNGIYPRGSRRMCKNINITFGN
jgi:hypothetical protein